MEVSKKKHGYNPKCLANLKPPKPGENRNPRGRPKLGFAVADLVREYGRLPVPESLLTRFRNDGVSEKILCGLTYRSATILRAWIDSVQGEERAREFLFDRSDGKPTPIVLQQPDRCVIIKGRVVGEGELI